MKQTPRVLWIALFCASLGLAACGGDDGDDDGNPDDIDQDGDGHTVAGGDCNDLNPTIHPAAPDPCDGVDQNCDGIADELYDLDEDGWTTCAGDCRDNDASSNPGASELVDGVDNDCDGINDNNTTQYDDDGDGYSEDQGDCNDDPNNNGALVGPDAVEVNENSEGEPEGVDNDCDGMIDEGPEPCPTDLLQETPEGMAVSMEICQGLISASWRGPDVVNPVSRGIFDRFGDTYVPLAGPDFGVLATGLAGDSSVPGWDGASTSLDTEGAHPDPQGPVGCSSADDPMVNDISELRLALQVPSNANAFSFDFNFMSIEFPEWVCSSFDDTFLAMLQSQAFNGNVSFDNLGNRVSINVGFFDVCEPGGDADTINCTGGAELIGTGYESPAGGGTGWLTTTAPVVPGEKIYLDFVIFDEGDHSLDSTVIIDNFRWEAEPVDGPITIDKKVGGVPKMLRP